VDCQAYLASPSANAHPDYPALSTTYTPLPGRASRLGLLYRGYGSKRKKARERGRVSPPAPASPRLLTVVTRSEDPAGTDAARDTLLKTLESWPTGRLPRRNRSEPGRLCPALRSALPAIPRGASRQTNRLGSPWATGGSSSGSATDRKVTPPTESGGRQVTMTPDTGQSACTTGEKAERVASPEDRLASGFAATRSRRGTGNRGVSIRPRTRSKPASPAHARAEQDALPA